MFELETCLAPQASVTISQKGLIAPCCQFNLWPEDEWFSIYDLDSLHEAHGTDRWNKYDSEPSGYDGSSKCRTCIREEESGAYSLRQTWNEKIKKEDKHIEHLEISLDFTCNMMCRSCGPSQSSKWNGSSVLEELQILNMPDNEGMYTAIKNPRNYQDNIKRVLNNTDLSHLKEVTIVGGEPLYSKSLPWFLSLLHEDVKLIVVTNGSLMPSDDMFSKFKSVVFQVSIDAIGDLGTAMRMKVPFETVDKNIAYSEYLGENLTKSIKYSEYIAENANTVDGTLINEESSEATIEESINESVETVKDTKSYKDTISEKLAALISKAETKNLSEMHFMNFLSESKKNQFDSLADDKKVLLVESMNSNSIMSTVQAENVWDSCFITERKAISFIDDMPEKFHTKWEALPANRQEQIIAESKFHSLNTPYAINNFWQTRDMRSTQMSVESINENKTAAEAAQIKTEPLVNEDFQTDLIKQMKFRLGR